MTIRSHRKLREEVACGGEVGGRGRRQKTDETVDIDTHKMAQHATKLQI
jgi:hypothetical protein